MQTTQRLASHYARLIGTEQRPTAPTVGPNDRLPPGAPLSSSMQALLDGLKIQYDGCKELAEISAEIVLKACDFALMLSGNELYEATQAELDALLGARAAMWDEQAKILAIVQPMLAKHGFPLPSTGPTTSNAG